MAQYCLWVKDAYVNLCTQIWRHSSVNGNSNGSSKKNATTQKNDDNDKQVGQVVEIMQDNTFGWTYFTHTHTIHTTIYATIIHTTLFMLSFTPSGQLFFLNWEECFTFHPCVCVCVSICQHFNFKICIIAFLWWCHYRRWRSRCCCCRRHFFCYFLMLSVYVKSLSDRPFPISVQTCTCVCVFVCFLHAPVTWSRSDMLCIPHYLYLYISFSLVHSLSFDIT